MPPTDERPGSRDHRHGRDLVPGLVARGSLAASAPEGDRDPRARRRGSAPGPPVRGTSERRCAAARHTGRRAQAGTADQPGLAARAPGRRRGRTRLGTRGVEDRPRAKALYIGAADYSKAGYRDFYAAFREAGVVADRALDAERVNRATLHAVDPFFLLEGLTNNLVAFASRRYQLQGPNTTLASHSPCDAQALELAARSVRQEQADVAIVIGSCVWSPFVSLFDLDALGLLSQCREGPSSFRPDRKSV